MSSLTLDQAFERAVAHHQAGRLLAAEGIYRQILVKQPRHSEALHLLGLVAHQAGHHEVAAEHISRAIRLAPTNPMAHLNLGEVYRALKRGAEAVAHYERALALRPEYAEAHNNLGLLRQDTGQLEEARARYEQALALRPDFPEAHNNLARTLKDSGRIEDAIIHYQQAADLRPSDARMHSNLIFSLHFRPDLDGNALHQEQKRWNQRHAVPLRASHQPHPNDREPERRLKIGYVSADFRQHPVSFFLFPLFREHDHRQVEVHAYASVKRPDAVTAGLQRQVDVWRDVSALSDTDLAAQVRADRIDILVDLTMHAANSRLLAFARRPAPVQVSWLAYPGTTGLDTIDYRLSDARMDPPGAGEAFPPGGAPVRLPNSWCCYHPLGQTPAVSDLPASRPASGRRVAFGCLNNFGKINATVLRHWGRLLAAVPNSCLLLHAPDEEATRRRVRKLLADGTGEIAGERVNFIPVQGRQDYLRTYGRIDIGLDPFPFNGMTTTCDALWMGVPVLALPGPTPGSRVCASLLTSVGLKELVAGSEEEHLGIARTLAGDLPRLAGLRATLRTRLEASPLMDAPRFARHVEQAYRTMWRRWCLAGVR